MQRGSSLQAEQMGTLITALLGTGDTLGPDLGDTWVSTFTSSSHVCVRVCVFQ